VIKIEILSDLNGAPLGRTEHCEPDLKSAQAWAAHWTREVVEGGFVPEGALLTYALTEHVAPADMTARVVDVVTYKHTFDEDITVE